VAIAPSPGASTTARKKRINYFSVQIPMHSFFGCLGVAPANGEAQFDRSRRIRRHLDSPEASAGNTVYFPVNVKGGLLYLGDGHAAMADGEAAGSAIEDLGS
jgi:acetamidase/formamidase